MVNELLDLRLSESTVSKVTLCVAIKEGSCTAKAHSSTVLLLNSTKVTEVGCLDSFLYVLSGLGDIAAIDSSHLLQFAQSTDLLSDLFAVTDNIGKHDGTAKLLLLLLILDQTINTVKSYTTIVADDTATAVSIRKTCDDVVGTSHTHLIGINIKYTCVVCLSVNSEELNDLRVYLITVIGASLHSHADTAVRHQSSLERSVCLETNDLLEIFVQITCCVRGKGGNDLGVHIQNTACFSFFLG